MFIYYHVISCYYMKLVLNLYNMLYYILYKIYYIIYYVYIIWLSGHVRYTACLCCFTSPRHPMPGAARRRCVFFSAENGD